MKIYQCTACGLRPLMPSPHLTGSFWQPVKCERCGGAHGYVEHAPTAASTAAPAETPAPVLVAFPPDMTLGELRQAFPADRFILVYRPDGSIEIRRRDRNGALIIAGSARIVDPA